MVRIKNVFWVFFLIMLAACGGNTSSPGGSQNNGTVSVIATDDLTQNFSEVWVTLYAIEAKGDNGNVTLFDNKDGQVINLADLNGVGSLLSVTTVPAGSYNSFDVKMGSEVNLVAPDGTTTTHSFVTDANSTMVNFEVKGDLVVADGAVTSFALDFDLSNFIINADGIIVPKIFHVKDISKSIKQTMAKMTGQITALTDTGFTLHDTDGMDINVVLNANALKMYDDGMSLDTLAVGMTVKVIGSYDPDTMTIEAITVAMQTPSSDAMAGSVEVKGVVTATSAGMFTINLKDADFMPSTDTMDVTYDDTTTFASGSADLLAVDQTVEVRGMRATDGSLTAMVIEIEGADMMGGANHNYADIKGGVVSLTDNTLTVMVDKVSGLDVTVGSNYDVDITNVFIKNGTLADIVAGAKVDVKGSVDSKGQFHACILEINPDTGTTGMGMMTDQAVFGTVTAIDASSMTITVNMSMNLPSVMSGDSVIVALTADTTYNNDMVPVVNDLVNVHVTTTDTGLAAQEVTVENSPMPVLPAM